MKKQFKLFSILIALFVILGSISFSGVVFGEEEDLNQNEPFLEDEQLETFQIQNLIEPLSKPNQYSIKTTDESGTVVNGNVHEYETKSDVYVRIDGEVQNYWVMVTAPGDDTVLGIGGPFAAGNHFNLYNATNFTDTSNNGGVYKVWVSIDDTFHPSDVKFDNFKIKNTTSSADGKIEVNKRVFDEKTETYLEDKSGFTFKLYKVIDGEEILIEEKITGTDGKIVFKDLPAGKYILKEEPIEGYTSDISNIPIILGDGTNLATIEVINTKTYNDPIPVKNIVVQKIVNDEENENPDLSGFTFRLYKTIYNEVGNTEEFIVEVTTDSNGLAVFEDIDFGSYILYEDPAEGYEMGIGAYGSGEGREIIHSEEYSKIIEVTNTKILKWNGTIEVIKTVADERNTSPNLAGFIFRLYKMVEGGEEFVEEQTTGSTGVLYFSGLEEAIYKLYELDRAGYIKGIANTGSIITLNGETVGEGNIITTGVTNIVLYSNEPEPETTPDPEEEPDDEDDEIEEDIPESIPEIIIAEDPEEEIILEEIPQAAPEEQILSVESVPEEEEELVVIEEAVPLAAPILPKTGSAPAYMTYGIGSLLLAIGAFLKKKKD